MKNFSVITLNDNNYLYSIKYSKTFEEDEVLPYTMMIQKEGSSYMLAVQGISIDDCLCFFAENIMEYVEKEDYSKFKQVDPKEFNEKINPKKKNPFTVIDGGKKNEEFQN